MKPVELKVARIGNSRGVRIPAATLERYRIGATVVMEERSDGILLRPHGPASPKLSWEETAREMAAAAEDWGPWDATAGDALDEIPWDPGRPGRVAERRPKGRARRRSRKR
jgi:antitoxin component of MazEF toxin-antitoxin module